MKRIVCLIACLIMALSALFGRTDMIINRRPLVKMEINQDSLILRTSEKCHPTIGYHSHGYFYTIAFLYSAENNYWFLLSSYISPCMRKGFKQEMIVQAGKCYSLKAGERTCLFPWLGFSENLDEVASLK